MPKGLTKAGKKKVIRAIALIRLARRLRKQGMKMKIKKAIRRKIRKKKEEIIMNKFSILVFFIFILSLNLVSAQLEIQRDGIQLFPTSDISGVSIQTPPTPEGDLNVNHSTEAGHALTADSWITILGQLDTVNGTQFENDNGVLTILETYLKTFGDNFWVRWIVNQDPKPYLYNDSNTIYFNETALNETIDQKTQSIEFNASVIETITGDLDGGVLADVLIRDNIFYNVSEVTGTPGFNIQINYTGVTNFNSIVARLDYQGSAAHDVVIELFDCTTGLYEIEFEFMDTDGVVDFIEEVLDATDHICGLDANVSLQIRHTSAGNPSHDIFIDGVHLLRGATAASPTEIDPLAIHKSGDVKWEGTDDHNGNNITNATWINEVNFMNVTVDGTEIVWR